MIKFDKRHRALSKIDMKQVKSVLLSKPALIILALGLGYWLFFAGGSGKDHKKHDVPVLIASVQRKDVPIYLNGLGTVQAYNTVTIHSQVDGRLEELSFKDGQDVRVGDVLAKIDARTYQAQYDQASANKAKDAALLENAKRDLARYVSLGKSVSDQTRDTQASTVSQLEAAVAADQAAIDNAKALLSYTVIAAPIDGRTGIHQVDVGNIVHTSDTAGLVVLTQLQPITVVFSLPQQNLSMINEQLNNNKTLTVMAMDADNKTVVDTGKLELVDNQIDQNTGTIRLKSTFPNAKRSLWPGGFTNIRLLVTVRKDALVIPSGAVQVGPKNSYVFLYKPEDGTVFMRPIKVAMTQDQEAIIDDGISEGDQVVTDGMAKLQDGSHVVLPSAEPAKDNGKDDDNKKHHHKEG